MMRLVSSVYTTKVQLCAITLVYAGGRSGGVCGRTRAPPDDDE